MAIALANNDISTRGITDANLAQFSGRERQVVINVDDGYRPIVMDGSTVGGTFFCASMDELETAESTLQSSIDSINSTLTTVQNNISTIQSDVSTIENTIDGLEEFDVSDLLTKTAAEELYLGISDTAVSATQLATARTIRTNLASTSTASFNGTANITPGVTGTLPISNGGTGATTAAAALTNLGALSTSATAASATKLATARTIQTNLASTSSASFDGTANITPGVTGTLPLANGGTGATSASAALTNLGAVAISGSRGSLAGYGTVSSGAAATISDSSADDYTITSGTSLTVNNGSSGVTWCKARYISSSVTSITLGSSWVWVNGEAPDLDLPGVLVCYWSGTAGIANFVSGAA